MYYWEEKYEFYWERDMQSLLLQRPYLINADFKMCGEEFDLNHNGMHKRWDLVAIDETFIYLIELKVKKIKQEDLDEMELIADKIKSYKPVKVLLVTPTISTRMKKIVSKYKKIEHIEIENITHNPNIPKPKKRDEIHVEHPELLMFQLLQFLDYDYFNYYRGYEIIENYYLCLKFKFNNNLGIILRYDIKDDLLEYELVKYITKDYIQTHKMFSFIKHRKLNIIFNKVLSCKNHLTGRFGRSDIINTLIEDLIVIEKMRKY